MSGQILIRRARADDAEALAAYMNDLAEENLDTIGQRRPTAAQERDWIEKTQPPSLILVALRGEDVVGLLDVQVSERKHLKHCGLFGISIAEPCRGQGIGRQMIELAITQLKSVPGFCRLELEVVPWNSKAIALYEKLGFKHEARKIKAVNFRGAPEDMLLMALTWDNA